MENSAWFVLLAVLFFMASFLGGYRASTWGTVFFWCMVASAAGAVIRFAVGFIEYLKYRKRK